MFESVNEIVVVASAGRKQVAFLRKIQQKNCLPMFLKVVGFKQVVVKSVRRWEDNIKMDLQEVGGW